MAFTEFYCQNGGSNLNAGSTTNNTAALTSTNGNWSTSTNIFTPTDGSTPASFVSVGDWVSIYLDGASVAVFIAKVTVVAAGVNGGITVSASLRCGTAPITGATGRSLKAGGAWQGPNGASGFPFSGMAPFGNSVEKFRVNLKNDQTYSITAGISFNSGSAWVTQGYSSSVGDGGRAVIDGGTSTGTLINSGGQAGNLFADLIFATSITTGSTTLVNAGVTSTWIRCVFHGARNSGILTVSNCVFIECEAYDCNKANAATHAGFNGVGQFTRCYAHDNAGSNSSGFIVNSGPSTHVNCISESNGQYGIAITGASVNGAHQIISCDIYNNTSDGINIATGNPNQVWIENTNLLKNGGRGINNVSTANVGYTYNLGYGSGTQANTSSDVLNNIIQSGNVTYASGVTPWNAPTTGDFRIMLAAAKSAGRGFFMETDGTNTGTIGYPDIGAAQALVTGSSAETSYSLG